MKLLLTVITLTLFTADAFASVLTTIQVNQDDVTVVIWKHTEDQDDTVTTVNIHKREFKPVQYYLDKYPAIKVVFNDGVFTSMQLEKGKVLRWAMMSQGEKDFVRFIQENFNVNEK